MKDVFVCDQVRAENKNIHYLSFLETQRAVQKPPDLVQRCIINVI